MKKAQKKAAVMEGEIKRNEEEIAPANEELNKEGWIDHWAPTGSPLSYLIVYLK